MILSRFNLWVEDYPRVGESLLFNTRTQALIKVTKDFRDTLSASRFDEVEAQLPSLKENGIVAEDADSEQRSLDDFFRQLKYDAALTFEVTILTTYDCNFRCTYCFEGSVKEGVFLDKQTSERITAWLRRYVREKGIRRVFLVYYGGEPLLNVGPVYEISRQMKQWAEHSGIEFGFGVITNGSLINPCLVEKLLPLGLRQVRISLDGDRETHDRHRPFADGSQSFDLIIQNIKNIIDKVPVAIAGNFDRASAGRISSLLDYLDGEGLLYELERIDFAPLSPRLGPRSNPGAVELNRCMAHFSEDGVHAELIALKKELMRRGLLKETGLAINACSLTMAEGGIAIDPHGAIYKCNALLGYPEFKVGTVFEDGYNRMYDEFLHADAWSQCPRDCVYLPMCQGGCRFFSFLENKNFHRMCCKKGFFQAIAPDLIKLEYEKLVS